MSLALCEAGKNNWVSHVKKLLLDMVLVLPLNIKKLVIKSSSYVY